MSVARRGVSSMLTLAVAVAMSLPAATAGAAGGPVDPDDIRGPLDVAAMTQAVGGGTVIHTLTMQERFSSTVLRRDRGALLLGLDRTNRSEFDPQRIVEVFYANGALRAAVLNADGKRIGAAKASRPNGRTVKVTVARRLLDHPPGYRWMAATFYVGEGCRRGCLDMAPDRRPLVHDYTGPTVTLTSFPRLSTDVSAGKDFPVRFAVKDTGLAGLRGWRVQRQSSGATTWSTIASASTSGRVTATVTGVEGTSMSLRVVAVDRHGNTTTSPLRVVTVPLDDAATALTGGYQGAWESTGETSDYRGTLSSTTEVGASLTHNFDGTRVTWIARGGNGVATVSVDGGAPQQVDLAAFSGSRQPVFSRTLLPGAHTIVITAVDGSVTVDGLGIR